MCISNFLAEYYGFLSPKYFFSESLIFALSNDV